MFGRERQGGERCYVQVDGHGYAGTIRGARRVYDAHAQDYRYEYRVEMTGYGDERHRTQWFGEEAVSNP